MAEDSTIAALELRIKQLELQLEKAAEKEAIVTVGDMNGMYNNHLSTIKFILLVISAVFAVLAWIGYEKLENMVQEQASVEIEEAITDIKIDAIVPLQVKYEEIIKRQEQQDKEIELEHYISLAEYHYRRKHYEEALDFSNKVIELDSDNIIGYANRGLVNVRLKQFKGAMKNFNKVIELDPNQVAAYSDRGAVKIRLKQYPEALKDFDKAIRLNPNFANSYYNQACVFALTNEPIEKVLESLKKAIELDKGLKEEAQEDDHFESIKENEDFRKLVGLD